MSYNRVSNLTPFRCGGLSQTIISGEERPDLFFKKAPVYKKGVPPQNIKRLNELAQPAQNKRRPKFVKPEMKVSLHACVSVCPRTASLFVFICCTHNIHTCILLFSTRSPLPPRRWRGKSSSTSIDWHRQSWSTKSLNDQSRPNRLRLLLPILSCSYALPANTWK
jgi:hypothetical protein